MGIVPAYRSRGLGARLINATLEAAFGAGFVRIESGVHADNEWAIALYDRVGFVREVPSRRWLELGWRSLRVAQPQ